MMQQKESAARQALRKKRARKRAIRLAGAAALAAACGDRLMYPVEANELFVRLTPVEAARLRAAGYDFYDWGEGAARLVVSWDQDAAVAPLAAALAAL